MERWFLQYFELYFHYFLKKKGEVACLADSRAKEAEERLKSESKRREYFERECTVL